MVIITYVMPMKIFSQKMPFEECFKKLIETCGPDGTPVYSQIGGTITPANYTSLIDAYKPLISRFESDEILTYILATDRDDLNDLNWVLLAEIFALRVAARYYSVFVRGNNRCRIVCVPHISRSLEQDELDDLAIDIKTLLTVSRSEAAPKIQETASRSSEVAAAREDNAGSVKPQAKNDEKVVSSPATPMMRRSPPFSPFNEQQVAALPTNEQSSTATARSVRSSNEATWRGEPIRSRAGSGSSNSRLMPIDGKPGNKKRAEVGDPNAAHMIASAIDKVLVSSIQMDAFIRGLKAQGVVPVANISIDGHMAGFRYNIGQSSFTASTIGPNYTWESLKKRGLIYNRYRDAEVLKMTKSSLRGRPKI